MEKGSIRITSTRKGFAGTLHYTKPNGQPGQMPILGVKFQNEKFQGDCEFEREGGRLIRLIAQDGTILLDLQSSFIQTNRETSIEVNIPMMVATDDIFNLQSTFLPKEFHDPDIQKLDVDNFSLKLNKAAYFEGNGEKLKFYFYRQGRGKDKSRLIQPNFRNLPIESIAARQWANAKNLFPTNENLARADFSPDWRLIVGLGGESVYETSITLHHVYGIPFIPASSIKGVVRSWIISNIFLPKIDSETHKGNKVEEEALQDPVFNKWFGSQDSIGKLTFFDAFPLSIPYITPDVMNPHYQEYYSDNKGQKAPTDFQRTNPISFLTVSGCAFQFIIGSNESSLIKDSRIDNKSISDWLHSALTSHGLGAKTAVGYGYFNHVP